MRSDVVEELIQANISFKITKKNGSKKSGEGN